MAASSRIKGWCPGAWRPMPSGDGLLVRVRPEQAALDRAQVLALCEASKAYGNGFIQLTNRANLQLRGVAESDWRPLMDHLMAAGLVDTDPDREGRRNLLVAPDWSAGDDTDCLARLLLDRLQELPELPAKVGFAIDTGDAPVLTDDSADFRIERAADGQLLVRADGRPGGTPVSSREAAIDLLINLARWFMDSGGADAGRMRRHTQPLPQWAPADTLPAAGKSTIPLGEHALGAVFGAIFGQVEADKLAAAVDPWRITGIRVTPRRRFIIEGAISKPMPGLLHDNHAPELDTDACPGAPHCDQAAVATRDLAGKLSGRTWGRLHVSGCSKGCARRQPADVCVVGQGGRYHLVFRGRADATPDVSDLTEAQVLTYFGVN